MRDGWEQLLDEARSDLLAQERARERWLRRQATESATLVGTILDLAESGTSLSLSTVGGRRHDGRVVGLGADVVVLEDRGAHTAVRVAALAVVRPQPGSGAAIATGDRMAALDLDFVELLGRVVDDQPEVAIALLTGEVLSGTMLGVGTDVITVRLAPGRDGIAYCSPSTVASVRFRSG